MLKGRFFRSLPVNIFWKSRTPFWISTKLCTVVLGHSRKPFLYWEVRKNVTSYDGAIRTFFCWKIQKIYTLLDSTANYLSTVYWITMKFGIEFPETCGHVTGTKFGGLKFLNGFAKNVLFWYFFILLDPN